MICTAYKSVSLLIYAPIAPSKKIFDTIGCKGNHIDAVGHTLTMILDTQRESAVLHWDKPTVPGIPRRYDR
jgi:hypothetical protein